MDRRLEVNLVLGLPKSLQFCLVMNELRPTQTHTYIKLSVLFFPLQALQHGFFDFESFDVDEYEHYEVMMTR
jgi:hypothetical protein